MADGVHAKLATDAMRYLAEDLGIDGFTSCVEKFYGCLSAIADEIEREQEEAYERGRRDVQGDGKAKCVRRLAEATGKGFEQGESITEWLDRWYLPLPTFEDGQPVQHSDIEEIGGLATLAVFTDGGWSLDPDRCENELRPQSWLMQTGSKGECVKRPEPPVPDAEGMPIERGDRVWDIESGKPYTVEEIANREAGMIQCCDEEAGDCEDISASNLTHREPDSLEKLRDDMKDFCNQFGRNLADDWKYAILIGFPDRLTALMERGA